MADGGARTATGGGRRSGPAGTRFTEVHHHSAVDSTNRLVAGLARQGAAEGLVVVADHQTDGRGRGGRRWLAAPRSSLLVSVLLRPLLSPERLGMVPIAMGLSATAACEQAAGWRPRLKWPNDLVNVGPDGPVGKLGGILTEVVGGSSPPAVVAGLGVNLRAPPATAQLPSDAPTPVALETLAGRSVDRDVLLDALLRNLEGWYRALVESDDSVLLATYRNECATLGSPVRVITRTERLDGVAEDVTDAGHLVLDTGGGRRVIAAADVVHLRRPTG